MVVFKIHYRDRILTFVARLMASAQLGGLEEFEGTVEKVEFEIGAEERRQYHIYIIAADIEVTGPTGRMHEWVPMSPKATEESVPNGSVADRYLTQMEICVPAIKRTKTLKEAFQLLVGRKFRFQRIKLGRDFEGHPAREYIVPVARLD